LGKRGDGIGIREEGEWGRREKGKGRGEEG